MAEHADAPVYEMLWDCGFCGTKKLLGVTHRHCPVCGGPQNADARYFPPDDEKVPAKQHTYYGADLKCSACAEANSRNSQHCRGCGAPLERAKDVTRRADEVEGSQPRAPEPVRAQVRPDRRRRRGRGLVIGAGVVVGGGALVGALTWSRPSELEVVGHRWKREVVIERYGPVSQSSWCDQLPSDARHVHRSREVRDHRKVEDGEECHTRKVDRGDGTYEEREECTPKYRDEPVYDDKCTYEVSRWKRARSETAQGTSIGDAPRWPAVRLAAVGQCEGCEREAGRNETFTVVLRDAKGSEHTCDFDANRWASLTDGTKLRGEVGVVTGMLSCATLTMP